jgi:type IV pilus assembly protein PilY1
MSARVIVMLVVLFLSTICRAAAPALTIAAGTPGAGRVPPNLLLNLAIGQEAVAAAYPGSADYSGARDYIGYFDARSCYAYPTKKSAGGLPDAPDLSETTGYFYVVKPTDARHECGGDSFSGNFMNWASASVLDVVRLGLTGGDRVIDRATLTVLQRAWLPEATPNADFYAHPRYFPRKQIGGDTSPRSVTPFDVPLLYIVSCRNRILFSDTAAGGNCDTPRTGGKPAALLASDKRLGEFLARVKVCDRAEGLLRLDLCTAFGANFKPSGLLQRYAEALHLGLFSYPTEHGLADPRPYGGVLRAPLDFIGASRRDAPDFISAGNDQAEWKSSNGVLLADPRPGGAAASGLVNYLNQLGRVKGSGAGHYKIAEPLSELYYEALRYLQGRQPSAGAPVWPVDAGFPVISPWADPLRVSCQRTRVLTVSGAATAADRYVPGNTRGDDLDAVRAADAFGSLVPFDVMDWTRRVGAMEADAGGLFGNPSPRPGLAPLDQAGAGDGGHGSYYIDGLAYWAHTRPLRPDAPALRIDNSVVALGAGAAVADRPLYLAAKYGGFADDAQDGNPFHDGGAAPFAFGDDPPALLAGLRRAFELAAAGAPVSGVPLLAPSSDDADGALFQSLGRDDGSARFMRRALIADGDGVPRPGPLRWSAVLPPAADRKIYTQGVLAGREGATVPFEWGALSEAQRVLLDRPPADAASSSAAPAPDGRGGSRVDAVRAAPLAASPHAAPLLVGAPSRAVQGAGYAAFYAAAEARRPVVYLGAGDGMLHAFDAAGGRELFAYVPNALIGALNKLDDDAPGARPAYVDGNAGSGEALIGSQWKTVLVSGMGAGAQGVFALDVGDPDHFAAAGGVLWEFTDADDPGIGNILAAPQVAKLNTAASGKTPVYRYFAVVSSGLNNYVNDGKGRYAGKGNGALYLLALDKAPAAAWKSDVNYYAFSAPIAEAGAVNGLGPPALVAGVDGALRYAYAGDLQGNLWRFDFSGAAPWSRAAGKIVYVARDDAGRRQPISARPSVVFAGGGGYQVLFGTGQWIADADADSRQPQSFYAIRDMPDGAAVGGRAALARRTLASAEGVDGGAASLTLSGDAFRYAGAAAKQGWYLDFIDTARSGERSVGDATLAAGTVFFNTVLPAGLSTKVIPACAVPAARSYAVDAITGFASADGRTASGFITGWERDHVLPIPPVVIELLSAIGPADATGARAVSKQYTLIDPPASAGPAPAAGTGGAPVKITLPARSGRVSWREVANWRELHDAVKK